MITKNTTGLLTKSYTNNEERSDFDPLIISSVEGEYILSPLVGDINDGDDSIVTTTTFYDNSVNGSKVKFYNGATTTDKFIRKISSNLISLYPTLADALANTNKLAITASAGQKIALQTFKLDLAANRNSIVNLDSFISYLANYDGNIQFIYPSSIADKTVFNITLSLKGSISGSAPIISTVLSSDLATNIFTKTSALDESLTLKTVYVSLAVGHLALEA